MGSKKEISEEDYKTYEHGVQVIDENKEFTYVQFPVASYRCLSPFLGGGYRLSASLSRNLISNTYPIDQISQPISQSRI